MLIALCCLLSALVLYIQALKNAMAAKRWACAGLLLGPVVVPLFFSQKRLRLMRAMGRGNVFWQPH
ncbi:hypothetical protein ACFOD1_03955 [Pseudidiomarina halophila]|uniref:Uncharacterized protein n=1 Tax=Pseudidiomarina halophila TaxID=1449799 RepID=A0A432XZA7_9GAMM|nr:hypothetical protein [Pseudidiomarina halophila]RUO54095.1 hypothetical protein CWI69_01305 [Pseudidiomarina halophila]